MQQEENVASRSDMLRLEVVRLYGGIYLDTDAHAFLPFDGFNRLFRWPFVVWDGPNGNFDNLCNCVFGAEKDSAFLKFVMEAWREGKEHHGLSFSAPHGCGVLAAGFLAYGSKEINVLPMRYMLHKFDGTDPIMTQSF